MRWRSIAVAATITLCSPLASAQDFQPYSESLNDSARQVRERMLRNSTVNRQRGGNVRGTVITAKTRRTCANRPQAAARLGRDHPDVRQLYALCAQAGL